MTTAPPTGNQEAPVTTTDTPAAEAACAAAALTLPELIARQLRSTHVLDNRVVTLTAAPGADYVVLDIRHPFPPESHMRVLLHLSEPVHFDQDGAVEAEIGDADEPAAGSGLAIGAPA